MRKKMGLTAVSVIVLLSGCSTGKDSVVSLEKEQNKGTKTVVRVFDRKVEVASEMKELAAIYEKSHPDVSIQFDSIGGSGANYDEELYSRLAVGDAPDIFTVEGLSSLKPLLNDTEPLTNEEWVKNAVSGSLDGATVNNELYGMPIAIEAYGFIYNKELFDKAGITKLPTTLTELEQASEKLKSNGITPFSNGYAEWWVVGQHGFNAALASHDKPIDFVQDLLSNKVDLTKDSVMNGWLDLLDLTIKYGNKDPFLTNYDSQVEAFASGKAAMMQQGNWTQLTVSKINPSIKVGMLPMPMTNNTHDYIFAGVPNYWSINKNSTVKTEAKEFMDWLVTSDEGTQFLVKNLKYIPAFKNIEYNGKDLGDIADSIQGYIKSEKTSGWYWGYLPTDSRDIYEDITNYYKGVYSREQLLNKIQERITDAASGGEK